MKNNSRNYKLKKLTFMKKFLLAFVVAIATVAGAHAQSWEWGTAVWNIEDGRVFADIDELNGEGIILTYPNPTDYTLTFLNIVAINYDLYVDDATEPLQETASAQASTVVTFGYRFVEGHKYKIVTRKAFLAQANLATYQTDTLSVNDTDSYTISFSIKGPELVKTIEVEGTQALTIVDQEYDLTYSLVDVEGIKSALGIGDISEARTYALNTNGSYCEYEWYGPDYFDGWRDADGELTTWYGGYNQYDHHNAYPAVYSIQLSEGADSVYYYFYDYWKEYDPNEADETGGSSVVSSGKRRAPETSYNSVIWDWDNGDGTVTQYQRNYRTDEGKDYKAGFIFIANGKSVVLNATLHFVSQEDYATYLANDVKEIPAANQNGTEGIYSLSGVRLNGLQKGVNIVRTKEGVKKVMVK